MNSSVVRKVWWVLIALISALAFAAAVNTGSAHAVSQSRAQTIADYYGAKWCPHHKWGVCLRRVHCRPTPLAGWPQERRVGRHRPGLGVQLLRSLQAVVAGALVLRALRNHLPRRQPPRRALVLMEHVLVTGGAGFIGSALIDELNAHGFDTSCVDHHDNRAVSQRAYMVDLLTPGEFERALNLSKPSIASFISPHRSGVSSARTTCGIRCARTPR
jgi:hypothetical protein